MPVDAQLFKANKSHKSSKE